MKTRNKPDGGFRFIGAYELLWVYFAFRANLIRWYDLRVWFACQEAVARRCGAKKGVPTQYRESEIHGLVGGAGKEHLRAALKRLERAGLLRWTEQAIRFAESPQEIRADDLSSFWMMVEDFGQANRKVPVPRRTIRLIAGGCRKVLTATLLGHLLRCCYFRKGEYSSEGSCSASWTASVFGLDERNVKVARKQLIETGWLLAAKADAWHRQRYGGRVVVNPTWSWRVNAAEASKPIVQRGKSEIKRSPQHPIIATERSPLLILKGNSFGSRNQKPALAPDRPAGFCKKGNAGSIRPTMRHVELEDLENTDRTLILFGDAASHGFVSRCEADRLKFVAAAERSLRVATRNPGGLFATLVRDNLWHHITLEEEDAARRRLRCAAEFGVAGGEGRNSW